MREKVYNFFSYDNQSGRTLILHPSSSNTCRLFVSFDISCGKTFSCGILIQRVFNAGKLPIYGDIMSTKDYILKV